MDMVNMVLNILLLNKVTQIDSESLNENGLVLKAASQMPVAFLSQSVQSLTDSVQESTSTPFQGDHQLFSRAAWSRGLGCWK